MGLKNLIALLCVGAAMVWATAARAQDGVWLRAESENFIVYSRGRERPLREAVQQLEQFNDLLYERTGAQRMETVIKVPVYLLRDEIALQTVWPTAGSSIRGFYTYQPEHVGAYAIYDDMGWEGVAQQILFHEYTHHFMMQHFPQTAYPTWYVEGYAEYMSTAEFGHELTRVGKPPDTREIMLVGRFRNELLPLSTMLGPIPTDGEQASMFYSQSWLMVHYMFSTPERQRAFNAYMRATNSGGDPVESFETAFGMSADQFREALSEYMRGTIQYWNYPNRELPDSTITVTRMPRSADNLLLLNARMLRQVEENDHLVETIVQEAARFPGDAYATRSAAYAELIHDPARARELVAGLINDPADYEAQYITGRSYYAEAENADEGRDELRAQARRHFVRAFRANPNHVPTLYYYVRSNDPPLSDEVMDVLIQAHLLAPQVDEIRWNLAVQLLNARRFQDAAGLLGPLAFDPHGGDSAVRARRYLDAARRNEMPAW